MPKKLKNVVAICGGTGGSELLATLRGHAHITAILPATDDGGSGGWVRQKFNMIAPGDFRRALIALSYSKDEKAKKEFLHRYTEGEMKGHVVGNLVLGTLYERTGDFDKAIAEAAKLFDVRDTILPVTQELTTLCAELEDGAIVRGETNIDVPKHDANKKIVRLFVDPAAPIHPAAKKAILAADTVLISVGDIYSSIIANLVIDGVPQALQKTKAKVVMLVNSVTKHGESDGFNASDFIKTVEKYAGEVIDVAIISKSIPKTVYKQFAKIQPGFSQPDLENIPARIKVVNENWNTTRGTFKADPKKVPALLRKIGAI